MVAFPRWSVRAALGRWPPSPSATCQAAPASPRASGWAAATPSPSPSASPPPSCPPGWRSVARSPTWRACRTRQLSQAGQRRASEQGLRERGQSGCWDWRGRAVGPRLKQRSAETTGWTRGLPASEPWLPLTWKNWLSKRLQSFEAHHRWEEAGGGQWRLLTGCCRDRAGHRGSARKYSWV